MLLSSELAAGIEGDELVNDLHRATLDLELAPPQITVVQSMLSACLGSLLTSLVVTPFDVVRVRIQQQEVLTKDCCNPSMVSPPSSSASAGRTAFQQSHPLPTAQHSPNEPFWINKSYCGTSPDCTKITSTYQGLLRILKNEGIRTLWRGLSITLLMSIPANVIYFTGYEYIRDHSLIPNHPLNPLLCGCLSRTIAATVISPFELIKTRLQSIPAGAKNGGGDHVVRDLLQEMYATTRAKGLGTLFKGLQITLWRDVPFSGIYWSCYETSKVQIGKLFKADFSHQNTESGDDWRIFATSFLSGSLAGTLGAIGTHPFDVGKTRLQIATDVESLAKKQPSMFLSLYNIYKTEGISALYAGIGPRVLKIAPACAIMVSSYEVGKKLFKNNQ